MKRFYFHQTSSKDRPAAAGFTIVELLAVVAIIALLTAFVVPATSNMLRGSQLTQAAQMVSDQLSLARQTALSKSHSVEVRIYQFSDPSMPGETVGAPGNGKYRALQCFEIQDSGAAVAMGKMQILPQTVIIDSGIASSGSNSLSTIISSAQLSPGVPTISHGTDAGYAAIPRAGTAYNAATFRFLRDGSANFSSSASQWYLTLHNLTDGNALASPPHNFVTIQVDPANGHILTFQP
jgi:uncharacterized protein (TIGR02596 family)